MPKKHIVLISWIFLILSAPLAAIDLPQVSAAPAKMSDEALAGYISSRLKLVLSDEGRRVDQYCDESGCAVVVQ